MNLVWAGEGIVTREPIPQPSAEVAALARGLEFDAAGRLLE